MYNLFIRIYWLSAKVMACFRPKVKLFVEGRKGLLPDIEKRMSSVSRPVMWFHCASVGEFEQARPVIERVSKERPDRFIFLTFFSPSGYELRKNYRYADMVCYLPMDTPEAAERLVSAVKPEVAVFVKYEFWNNCLHALGNAGCRVYLISAVFRPGQHFFRWYGSFFRRMLECYDRIFVQDDSSAALLASVGMDRVSVCGDTRFDRVSELASSAADLPVVERFACGEKCFVAGSSWRPDEEAILAAMDSMSWKTKMIFVPHEVEVPNIDRLCSTLASKGYKATRYSVFSDENLSGADFDVLVVDNVGMLSSIYRYASVAYVGGGFGVGIHNILEAAVYGVPVIFGPNHGKFLEAAGLKACGGGFAVDGEDSLAVILKKLAFDAKFRKQAGKNASDYVHSRTGATDEIMKYM